MLFWLAGLQTEHFGNENMISNDSLKASLSADVGYAVAHLRSGSRDDAIPHGFRALAAGGHIWANNKIGGHDHNDQEAFGNALAFDDDAHKANCRELITLLGGGAEACAAAESFATNAEAATSGVLTSIALRLIAKQLLDNVPEWIDNMLYHWVNG